MAFNNNTIFTSFHTVSTLSQIKGGAPPPGPPDPKPEKQPDKPTVSWWRKVRASMASFLPWIKNVFWILVWLKETKPWKKAASATGTFNMMEAAARTISLRACQDAQNPNTLEVREQGGNNCGPSVEIYLKSCGLGPGFPWCMAFVVYRLITAAHELGLTITSDMPRTAATVQFSNWAKSQGYWISRASVELGHDKPQEGDLVFFYFPSMGRISHVGIVVEAIEGGVITIEGNTSSGTGVNRNGDGVYRRIRTYANIGTGGGFCRLPF